MLINVWSYPLGEVKVTYKSFAYQNWYNKRTFCIYFYCFCVNFNFSPRLCFVWSSTSVWAIYFCCSIDTDREIRSISHQISVVYVMLNDTTTKYNHTTLFSKETSIINKLNVLNKVYYESLFFPRVEIYHIAECTICKSRTVNRNVVFPAPVVDRSLVLDLFSNPSNNFAWSENCSLLLLLFVAFLD